LRELPDDEDDGFGHLIIPGPATIIRSDQDLTPEKQAGAACPRCGSHNC
jgi:hypothetical protein